jgi:hypothetical protein
MRGEAIEALRATATYSPIVPACGEICVNREDPLASTRKVSVCGSPPRSLPPFSARSLQSAFPAGTISVATVLGLDRTDSAKPIKDRRSGFEEHGDDQTA